MRGIKRIQVIRFGVICLCLLVYIALLCILKDDSMPNKSSETANNEFVCNIPKLDPFNPAMREGYDDVLPRCDGNGSYPLMFTTDLENHIIVVNRPQKYGYSSCCYRILFRNNGDSSVQWSIDCVQLTAKKTKVSADVEHIAVICTNSSNKANITVDAFGFVHLKSKVEARILKIERKSSPFLNVVMLGVDSVSHMHLIRDLPKSYHYLTHNLSGIGMNSYVKVGENTFPNLVPMLTGLSWEELANTCWEGHNDTFDDCPFIWKKFSDRGYRTSFLEDVASTGPFNYLKAGFKNFPVDYYLHPLTLFMENNLVYNENICTGPRFNAEILLEQVEKTAWAMKNVGKYFQFAMTATLSHDAMDHAQLLDDMVLKNLKFFNDNGFLNRTLYIFMSDHGFRIGGISNTPQGRIENRMPFLYFVFPPWFIDLYPKAIENLKENQDRLTTPFDLHETLKDIIAISDGNFRSELLDSNMNNVPRGISLFRKIPPNRTCLMAGIQISYCVCSELTPILPIVNNSLLNEAAHFFIERTNQKLSAQTECFELSLKSVLTAFDVKVNRSGSDHGEPELETLMLTVETNPGGGIFEVMVDRPRPNVNLMMNAASTWNLSAVSRINRFGNQSHCINEPELKIYCLCRGASWLEWSMYY